MIKANNLTIEYRKRLFTDLSFTLGNNETVGLIGLNGCGKSTLLKILAGVETPDSGRVELVSEKIAYFPQEYSFPEGELVGEVLESFVGNHKTEMFKVNKVLADLKFTDIDWYIEAGKLSYGQKMKLYLAKLLVKEPTILLLDEPTNHLDIYGIMWLEDFIKSFNGITIMVSHDRVFLNAVINKVFEIDEGKLNIFTGNYDDYLDQKDYMISERAKHFRLQEKKREKFEGMIALIKKQGSGSEQARALKAARTRMEREVTKKEIDLYKEQKIKDLSLDGSTHKKKLIAKIKDLDFGYALVGNDHGRSLQNDKLLIHNANLEIYGKEKVWFYGANGIGKSTLIRLLVGELKPTAGEIRIGENLNFAYFSQDQAGLPKEQTVEEYFLHNTDVSYHQSFSVMERFLFDKEMRSMKIEKLSPGQRARLIFAVFALQSYDFLILDEPTNHLDIKSKEVIETALREFEGTILLISHDRYFVENIGISRAITIEDNEVREVNM